MAILSDETASALTKALNLAQLDMQNQDKLFNSSGDVTITRPDGSTFTGASWRKMMSATTGKANAGANSDITSLIGLTTALSIGQGGTGAKTAADARTKLELGSAATKTAQTGTTDATAGSLMQVGAFGLGDIPEGGPGMATQDGSTPSGFYSSRGDGYGDLGVSENFTTLLINRGSRPTRINQSYALKRTWFSYFSGQSWTYHEAYTTGNTTKASDGTLKAASPVARIVKSQDENQRTDVAKDGFAWCGCGAANDEAAGISISRLDVGVYVITGAAGLATEGWQLLPPMDPLGSGELGLVEAEQTGSGGITVYLFRRKYMQSDDGEIVKTKGEPIDVPANSWIDVRLDMPANSIRNAAIKNDAGATGENN